MDVQQQIQILEDIIRDTSELLESSKAEVVSEPQPCLGVTFRRGVCPWIEKEEEIFVLIDIPTIRCMESDIPHLRFTAYFPYSIQKHDDIHLRFILSTLNVLCLEMPFIDLGVVTNSKKQEILVFRCNRLFTDIKPPEILFFVQQVVVAIEYFVERYKAFLTQNGIRLS